MSFFTAVVPICLQTLLLDFFLFAFTFLKPLKLKPRALSPRLRGADPKWGRESQVWAAGPDSLPTLKNPVTGNLVLTVRFYLNQHSIAT